MADYYTDNTIMFCYVDPIYVCVCVLVIVFHEKNQFFILKMYRYELYFTHVVNKYFTALFV